jgi:transcriptional regulator with XRE-family HTH domain
MTLGTNIKTLREKRGLSGRQFAEKVFAPQSSISKIERDLVIPRRDLLERIAHFLEVDISTLYADKTGVLTSLDGFRRIPVLDGRQIAALNTGTPRIPESEIRDYVLTSQVVSSKAFAMKIQDSAMAPEFIAGDRVIIDPSEKAAPGDYVVAVTPRGEAILRQYRDRGLSSTNKQLFELFPKNDMFPVIKSELSDIHIVGLLKESHRPYPRSK